MSWGVTACLTDVSDLFREEIEGESYKVDGEWRELRSVKHTIKVKDQDPVEYEVKYTHRGPLMTASVIKNAQVLFGSQIPLSEQAGTFSLAWAGHVPGESLLSGLEYMTKSKDLPSFIEQIKGLGTYLSVPQNIVLADTSGNIGYMLLSSSPKRRNEYPYLGCRVLDGTTSDHDWEGIVGIDHLPIVLNPAKGYYMTANHRIVPENSKFDIGASMISTGRSLRI